MTSISHILFQKFRHISYFFIFLFSVATIAQGCSTRSNIHSSQPMCQLRRKKNISAKKEEQLLALCNEKKKERSYIYTDLIYLDPGHGGQDAGAESKFSSVRLQEKRLTLETAKLIQSYLRHHGFRVEMTRLHDIFVPLKKRVEMANTAQAALFISIHYNSALNSFARGCEIFFYKNINNIDRSNRSKKLAEVVLKYLKDALPSKSRGVKHGDFCVIRETIMPAILVEAAFLSNKKDVMLLNTRAYKQRIAKAISQGIQEYINRHSDVLGAN